MEGESSPREGPHRAPPGQAGGQPYGSPPAGQPYGPPPTGQPYGSPRGGGQPGPPPGGHPYPPAGAPRWPQPSHAAEPGNGPAVAALVLGLCSVGFLVLSLGFLFLITLPCGIAAIFLARSGKARVDRGDTRMHRGLAQAGLVTGIVGVVLSLAAVAGCAAIVASEDFQEGFQRGFDRELREQQRYQRDPVVSDV